MVSLKVELTQTADGLSAQFISGLQSVKQNNRNVNVLEVKCSNFALTQNQTVHAAFSTSVEPDDVNAEDTGALLVPYQATSNSYKLMLPAAVLARRGTWHCTLSVRTWCSGRTPCTACQNAQTGACSDTCAYLETYAAQENASVIDFEVYEAVSGGGGTVAPTEADIISMYRAAVAAHSAIVSADIGKQYALVIEETAWTKVGDEYQYLVAPTVHGMTKVTAVSVTVFTKDTTGEHCENALATFRTYIDGSVVIVSDKQVKATILIRGE